MTLFSRTLHLFLASVAKHIKFKKVSFFYHVGATVFVTSTLLFLRRISVRDRSRVLSLKETPLILAGNHSNFLFDAIVLGLMIYPRVLHFLAKAPLLQIPVLGFIFRNGGVLPVARPQDGADTSSNRAVVDLASMTLKAGECLGIFPEGTCFPGTRLRPFKSGVVKLARKALQAGAKEVAIVPVVSLFQNRERCFGDCWIRVLPPIHLTEAMQADNLLLDRIFKQMSEVFVEMRSEFLKPIYQRYCQWVDSPMSYEAFEELHEMNPGMIDEIRHGHKWDGLNDFVFALRVLSFLPLLLIYSFAWLIHCPLGFFTTYFSSKVSADNTENGTHLMGMNVLVFPFAYIVAAMFLGKYVWVVGVVSYLTLRLGRDVVLNCYYGTLRRLRIKDSLKSLA